MNNYTLLDLKPGMEEYFRVTVTEDMMQKFLEISNDTNPLHTDRGFAQGQGYPDRVVYGMMTASFYSTLSGVYLPGKHCLLWEVDAKFTVPVFVGDNLEISGKIIEVIDQLGFIKIKARIKNQKGKTVSRAIITAGVKE